MKPINIPLDILDAFTIAFLQRYRIAYTRTLPSTALIQYNLFYEPWGEVGFIQLRKMLENRTDFTYQHPLMVTDEFVMLFISSAHRTLQQQTLDRLKAENPNLPINELIKRSGAEMVFDLRLLYPGFTVSEAIQVKIRGAQTSKNDTELMQALNQAIREYINSKRATVSQWIFSEYSNKLIAESVPSSPSKPADPVVQPALPGKMARMEREPRRDASKRVALALYLIEKGQMPNQMEAAKRCRTSVKTIRKYEFMPEVTDLVRMMSSESGFADKIRQTINNKKRID